MPGFLSRSLNAAAMWLSDDEGNPIGTPANPLSVTGGGGGGSGTPTGSAGSPNPAVVTVQGISGGTPQPVAGDVASGTADSGNPVKVGGVVNTGSPTALTTGQRTDTWMTAQGAVIMGGIRIVAADALGNNAIMVLPDQTTASNRALATAGYVFNGTTWDRQRGDTNGSYTVSKGSGSIATTQVSVGTTSTQIVAARSGRGSVKITNLGTNDVYIGNTGVTSTTGDLLPGTKGASITVPANVAIFGVATAAQAVSVMEVF